ncbi:hypothetical protein B0E53_06702 [Micromonospora sp. MH33]|nr:hypothetical protein B0E53_06702 [Micromonospora sp. MH33]
MARPCPGIGRYVTTGTPQANASWQVSPPAFSTTTSTARISVGMSSTQPKTCSSPALSRWYSSSFRPHTTTGRTQPVARTSATVASTSPAPQAPATISANRSSGGRPRRCRACRRSIAAEVAKSRATSGWTTVTSTPSAALAGCTSACRTAQ